MFRHLVLWHSLGLGHVERTQDTSHPFGTSATPRLGEAHTSKEWQAFGRQLKRQGRMPPWPPAARPRVAAE